MKSIALAATLFAFASVASTARADDGDLLRGPRVEILPSLGVGMGTFTSPVAHLPSTIGFSVLSFDFVYDGGDRWGGFARGMFLSSGGDGRWTSPGIGVGAQYRLGGDGEIEPGYLLRGGATWQRWHASLSGCSIPFFYPNSCQDEPPPSPAGVIPVANPNYDTTIDTFGLFAGARVELPVTPLLLAVGAEVAATADVTQASPGLALTGQLTFSFALRNHQSDSRLITPANPTRRLRRDW